MREDLFESIRAIYRGDNVEGVDYRKGGVRQNRVSVPEGGSGIIVKSEALVLNEPRVDEVEKVAAADYGSDSEPKVGPRAGEVVDVTKREGREPQQTLGFALEHFQCWFGIDHPSRTKRCRILYFYLDSEYAPSIQRDAVDIDWH